MLITISMGTPSRIARPSIHLLSLGDTYVIVQVAMAHSNCDPTRGLQSVLHEFQSSLNDAERLRLSQIKETPNVDSAIQFTALLDRENTERKGASLATRVYAMLLSVQQFSGIVDTFISSNPSISALVWGSVKLTMMVLYSSAFRYRQLKILTMIKVVVNFTSYFDVLSKVFLDFEQWSPRFGEYQLLYPSSARLQYAICEFHAAIVRCCKQVVTTMKRTC